jgi:hypothetical protein
MEVFAQFGIVCVVFADVGSLRMKYKKSTRRKPARCHVEHDGALSEIVSQLSNT